MGRRFWSTALLCLAMLGVGGCGSGAQEEPEPPLAATPQIKSPAELTLPLDAYLIVRYKWNAPDRAINMLGKQCMMRFGLDWPVIESSPPDRSGADNSRRYGVIEMTVAETFGYHAPVTGREWKPVQTREPTRDERAVWAGLGVSTFGGKPVPEGGCAREAQRKIEEGVPAAPSVNPQDLGFRSYQLSERDSRVQAAFSTWSRCMEGRGFRYHGPMEAIDDQRWFTTNVPSQSELETAKADVACKDEANVVGVWFAVESAYQLRMVDQNREQLDQLRAYYEGVVSNAAALVGQGRTTK